MSRNGKESEATQHFKDSITHDLNRAISDRILFAADFSECQRLTIAQLTFFN
jgi:hypothetical protein